MRNGAARVGLDGWRCDTAPPVPTVSSAGLRLYNSTHLKEPHLPLKAFHLRLSTSDHARPLPPPPQTPSAISPPPAAPHSVSACTAFRPILKPLAQPLRTSRPLPPPPQPPSAISPPLAAPRSQSLRPGTAPVPVCCPRPRAVTGWPRAAPAGPCAPLPAGSSKV